jgi:hypothetical protein
MFHNFSSAVSNCFYWPVAKQLQKTKFFDVVTGHLECGNGAIQDLFSALIF